MIWKNPDSCETVRKWEMIRKSLESFETAGKWTMIWKNLVFCYTRKNFTGINATVLSRFLALCSVVALLQAGADPLLPDNFGALPIHKAADHNHSEVVGILIQQGGCSIDLVR